MIRDWQAVASLQIAIDGPSGSGKGAVAQRLGQELALPVLDTGLLYRFVGWLATKQAIDLQDEQAVLTMLEIAMNDMQWCVDGIHYQGENCTANLRNEAVGALASQMASMLKVREALLDVQRQMATAGAIMDGRDIGTVVLPQAQAKFFLTASLRERARRRWAQLGESAKLDVRDKDSLGLVQQELQRRDRRDVERDCAPLLQAEDALVIDSTILSIDQVIDRILAVLERKKLIWSLS